jgi:hypothetical protein
LLIAPVNRTVPRPALATPTTGLGAHHGVSAFVWPAPRSGGRVINFHLSLLEAL